MAKQKAAASPSRSWLWLQGALCGGLVVLAPGTALVLGTLLSMAFATLAFEQTPGRPVGRSMLLVGGATALMPLIHLWEGGGSLSAGVDILSDPVVPLWSWAASGSLWLIAQLWEVVALFIMQQADAARRRRLEQERTELVQEWRDVS